MSSFDIALACIADVNAHATTFPDTGTLSGDERKRADALFSFATSQMVRNNAPRVPSNFEAGGLLQWAAHDGAGNMAGIATKADAPCRAEDAEAALADLLALARVSSLVAAGEKRDGPTRARVRKLLRERCTATGAKIETVCESVEVLRRVLEKRNPPPASPVEQKSAEEDRHHHRHRHQHHKHASDDDDDDVEMTPSSPKDPAAAAAAAADGAAARAIGKAAAAAPSGEAAEGAAAGGAEEEPSSPSRHALEKQMHADWDLFQKTMQYKIATGVLTICGLISLVFFICNPNLTACSMRSTTTTETPYNQPGNTTI